MILKESPLPVESASRRPAGEDISLLALVNLVLRHRWLILLLPLGVAAAVMALSLARPRTYSASAAFVAQAADGSALRGLAGMAAQFGVAVPAQNPGESPAFYADLLRSPTVLESLARTRYRVAVAGRSFEADLGSLITAGAAEGALAAEEAVRALEGRITVNRNRETGVVGFTVTSFSPELAQHMAARLIELVNGFDLSRRRSQAHAEREFVEQRMEEARTQLLAAETRLERFLRRNRQFGNSPELQFEHDRLERAVGMRQEVYTTLAQSYEQARLDEVRNLPVITVVEDPKVPVRPDPRGTVRKGIVAFVIGLVVALLIALMRGMLRHARSTADDDYREFLLLRTEALRDVLNPARGIVRAFVRSRGRS